VFDPGARMPIPGQDLGPTRAERERAERDRRTVLSPEMVRILRDSSVRIDTLRPASPPVDQAAYVAHMDAGQELLRAGRFFDAEDRFTRALSALPRDPMAAIARVHAQIGAGLFLSAASNLREVLRANPEIAAARFNVALAPSEDRSRKIAEQLRQEIERGSDRMAADAALLLAYLGRLHDDAAMRDEGLNAWKSRIAEDNDAEAALHELLSKVWGAAP
jgi:tetratricopeptide (TPR) repeat protein